MSRMAPLDPLYDPALDEQFRAIMTGGRPVLALFRTIARSPRAWRKFTAGSLLDKGPLSLRQREIVIDRTCARTGCDYEWGIHVAMFAERAGLTEAEIADIAAPSPGAAGWIEAERVLVNTVDALHDRATLSDAEYCDLAHHYDADQILEIMMLAGFYRTVAYIANGLAIPPEPDTPRLPLASEGAPDAG